MKEFFTEFFEYTKNLLESVWILILSVITSICFGMYMVACALIIGKKTSEIENAAGELIADAIGRPKNPEPQKTIINNGEVDGSFENLPVISFNGELIQLIVTDLSNHGYRCRFLKKTEDNYEPIDDNYYLVDETGVIRGILGKREEK